MSFKELRQETKTLFKTSQAHPYLVVLGIYILIYAVSTAIQGGILGTGILKAYNAGSGSSALMVCIYTLLYVAYLIFVVWAGLSLNWYYLRISRREKASDSFKIAFKALPGYIVYSILCSLLIIAAALLPLIFALVLAAANAPVWIIVLLLAVMTVTAVYMSLTFAFGHNCYYDRGEKSIVQTVKSNFEATRGHRLQILKLIIIYGLPLFVIYGVAFGLFAYLAITVQSTDVNKIMLGAACIMLLAFVLLAVYAVWMLPNLYTSLSIMYNNITKHISQPEQEHGDIVAIEE